MTPCYATRLVKAVSGVAEFHVSGSRSQESGRLGLSCTSTGHHKVLSGSSSPPAKETREMVLSFGSNSTLLRPLSHDGRFDFRWPLDGVELGRFAPTVARLPTP